MQEHAGNAWLYVSIVYLGAAVLAVPLARRAGLGSIIGYLAAGVLIGPWGLKFVGDPQSVLHFAEFGVVLMLFLVGLELEPKRLWSLRRPIFGGGTMQLLGSALLIGAAGWALGLDWRLALVAGLGLGLSSTAIGLGVLAERNLTATSAGQYILSVALLQDMAAIPILALLPALTPSQGAQASTGWSGAAIALGVVVAIVLGGRLLLRPALRWIARSATPEIFTAAALLLVVATAALMQAVGLSMALGAFLAGVLLAESEYRRELETDLEPFKSLMLGLFFMAVGMSLDFAVVARHPWIIAGAVVGFLMLKALVLWVMARRIPLPLVERPVFLVLLAQGGEFGFVVFQAASQNALIEPDMASMLVAIVALSMMLSPLLMVAADQLVRRKLAPMSRGRKDMQELNEPQDAPVIIAGFGRYGQIVGRMLYANDIHATVLEHDADAVESLRNFGWSVHYGDATRLDLLRMAGAERARVLVIAIDDMSQSLKLAELALQHFPHLTLVARARNVDHWLKLKRKGVHHIERETLDSSLMSARSVLETLGFERHHARNLALRFRQHSVEQLEKMLPHIGDRGRLMAISKAGRQQLEELFAQERLAGDLQRAGGDGTHPPASPINKPEDGVVPGSTAG